MLKVLGSIVAVSALMALPATAQPLKMTNAQLDEVVAAGGYYPKPPDYCPPKHEPPTHPPTKTKGNNGWGNGADPTNPGSSRGATSASKLNDPTSTPHRIHGFGR